MLDDGVRHRLEEFAREVSGRVIADVPLCSDGGVWPPGTGDHRIDAIVVHQEPAADVVEADRVDDLDSLVDGSEVSLVVASGYVDRPMLGHLLAGTQLFSRSHPGHGRLSQVAVVDPGGPEANAAWVHAHHGVEVIVLDS